MVLLRTAPLSDWEVVIGKYLSVFLYLGGLTLLTIYMPLLVLVHGRVSGGHFNPVLSLAALDMGHVLLSIAALGFLGFGIQPPTPEWGTMIMETRATKGTGKEQILDFIEGTNSQLQN